MIPASWQGGVQSQLLTFSGTTSLWSPRFLIVQQETSINRWLMMELGGFDNSSKKYSKSLLSQMFFVNHNAYLAYPLFMIRFIAFMLDNQKYWKRTRLFQALRSASHLRKTRFENRFSFLQRWMVPEMLGKPGNFQWSHVQNWKKLPINSTVL